MEINENGDDILEIPTYILTQNNESPLLSLVHFFYLEFVLNMMSFGFFDDGAIICPTIESVEHVIDFMLSLINSKKITYLSSNIG